MEVGSTALAKTSIIRTEILLFLVANKQESEKLVMLLLLQVMTIKTDRKAKYYFNCRMKADTSVRTFVETHDSLASVIFDTRNFKRVTQLVYPGCQRLFLRGFQLQLMFSIGDPCDKPLVVSAFGRFLPTLARKNLWCPGYNWSAETSKCFLILINRYAVLEIFLLICIP